LENEDNPDSPDEVEPEEDLTKKRKRKETRETSDGVPIKKKNVEKWKRSSSRPHGGFYSSNRTVAYGKKLVQKSLRLVSAKARSQKFEQAKALKEKEARKLCFWLASMCMQNNM
jgi:hypothetical protein